MFKIIFILLTLLFPSPLYGGTESNLIKVIIKDVLKNRDEQKNETIEECKFSSKVEFLSPHKMDRKSK
jgi:hypothetical protein